MMTTAFQSVFRQGFWTGIALNNLHMVYIQTPKLKTLESTLQKHEPKLDDWEVSKQQLDRRDYQAHG